MFIELFIIYQIIFFFYQVISFSKLSFNSEHRPIIIKEDVGVTTDITWVFILLFIISKHIETRLQSYVGYTDCLTK